MGQFRRADFITALADDHRVAIAQRLADIAFVSEKMHRWPQLQSRRFLSRKQPIRGVQRVLPVDEQQAFFDDETLRFVDPNRQPVLQLEIANIMHVMVAIVRSGRLLASDHQTAPVGQPEKFPEMIQHHYTTKRRGQRRDEQAVITARNDAANCARSVAAESVREQPFATENLAGIVRLSLRDVDGARECFSHAPNTPATSLMAV